MSDERPFGSDAVEAFYARQRTRILARVEDEAADAVVRLERRRRGARWLAGLAAAAIVVLGVATLLVPPRQPAPVAGWVTEVAEAAASLPLPAYAEWTEGEAPASVPEEDAATLAWLLEGDGAADGAVPAFLAPYGAWTDEGTADET
jgi:hypothetical protein